MEAACLPQRPLRAGVAAASTGQQTALNAFASAVLNTPRGGGQQAPPLQLVSPGVALHRVVFACSSSPGSGGQGSGVAGRDVRGPESACCARSANYPRRAVALRGRSISFRLEAAETPRGEQEPTGHVRQWMSSCWIPQQCQQDPAVPGGWIIVSWSVDPLTTLLTNALHCKACKCM